MVAKHINIAEIRSEAELAAIAGELCLASSLTPAERELINRATVPVTIVRAIRGLIAAGEDPLGDTFIQLRSSVDRRKKGAVYTPAPIVARMIAWAKDEGSPVRIVDPGSGSGRFLLAAAGQWRQAKLVACEIDPLAALILRANTTVLGMSHRLELFVGDYRELPLPPCKGATLFIGNPPYVRHHGIESRWKRWFVEASQSFGFKASKLAGLHAHFFVRTRQLARKGDYGTFITSAEWLDVNYGGVIREMLGNGLGGMALGVINPEALPFADAMTTAAISCFKVGSHSTGMTVSNIRSLSTEDDQVEQRQVDWTELKANSRWSIFVRNGARRGGPIEVGDLFRVHRGQVTGANGVWIEGPMAAGIPSRFLFPSVTKGLELLRAGDALTNAENLRRVIDLPIDLDELADEERRVIRKFLGWARELGTHNGFIASNRRAWWSVGLREPAPILCTYMARRAPAFVRNRCGAHHINIAHGLYPREPMDEPTMNRILAYLRTNVSIDSGRIYAGGLAKFEPGEIQRLTMPALEDLAAII